MTVVPVLAAVETPNESRLHYQVSNRTHAKKVITILRGFW